VATRHVVIEVSPSRLEVTCLTNGQSPESKVERFSIPTFSEDWRSALAALAPRLQAMIASLGASGAKATILYSSPTATTGLFSCPRGAGRAQAERAAGLALAEAAAFPLASNPSDISILCTDPPGHSDEAKGQQVHSIGVADSDASTQALADWALAAGVRPVRLVPGDAVAIIAATDRALELSSGKGTVVVLHVGEHGSVLAAATAGRLRFVRQLAVGVESFVEAMACRTQDDDNLTGAYNTHGSEVVYGIGIPTRERAQLDGHGSQAATILPAIQPILQRCVVDLKQSLRFGLDETERKEAKLVGMGPGASIPRLLEVISEQTGLALDPSAHTAPSRGSAISPGIVSDWNTLRPLLINLLPRSLALELMSRRVARGMWAGFAAAGVLIVAGAVLIRADLSHEQELNQTLLTRLAAVQPALALEERFTTAGNALSSAKQRVAASMSQTAEWDAAMVMLAQRTPPTIKITEASFAMAQGKPTCRLIGYTSLTAQADANTSLKEYLDALSAIPLVRTCRLEATQRVQSGDGTRQVFEAFLVLVEVPAEPEGISRNITSVPPEEQPR